MGFFVCGKIYLDLLITYINYVGDLMTAESKQNLKQQLWNIANTLRGKMGADEFRDYTLGSIFFN